MRKLSYITILVLMTNYLMAQVSITSDNSLPDASAMLDVKSTAKGMLVPRMTTVQRDAIATPATGLLVFVTDTNSFWYYNGTAWIDLLAGSITFIQDADMDTKIQVEENPDEDIIRLDIGGTEAAQFTKNANGDLMLIPSSTNVFIGTSSGNANTGDSNVFIGKEAARLNTTGRRNTVVGSQAGFSLLDGTNNVYMGTIAGRDNASGSRNVGLGDGAGAGATGNSNTCVGTSAGTSAAGSNNVLIGDSAGANNTAGNTNVMLGIGAGLGSSGSNNVFIGYFAGTSETGDNTLYIDNSGAATPLIYGEFDNRVLRVDGSLTATGIAYPNAGINFPNSFGPDAAYVGNTGNSISFGHSGSSEDFLGYATNNFYFRDSPGGGDAAQPNVYAQGFLNYSSGRWKHNIKDLNNGLAVIKQLRGVSYTWNQDHGGANDFGFIAEEIHEILPQIAPKNPNGQIEGVEYGKLTPYLVEAIKEQQTIIEQQSAEIKELKALYEAILKRME